MRPIRLWIALGFIGLCALLILYRVLQIAVIDREKKLVVGEKIARKYYSFPAIRGRVFDKNGKIIAWSEYRFDLFTAADAKLSKKTIAALQKISIPVPTQKIFNNLCLYTELSTAQLAKLRPIIANGAPLVIKKQKIRKNALSTENWQKILGNVKFSRTDSCASGGFEEKYDDILRGTPGKCSVLVDKRGNWIPGSLEMIEEPIRGKDVFLPYSIDEINAMNEMP